MLKNFFAVIMAYVGIAAWAFTGHPETKTGLIGRVMPADGVEVVWVLGGKDSAKAPLVNGAFSLEVKPGIYQVVVDAKSPYKDVVLDNLTVAENETLDVGEIVLKQ